MDNASFDINLKKKILLVTRPIAPPWDEASKNFAFTLAKNSPDFEFTLLTYGKIAGLPENIIQEPVYTSNKLTWPQRARLLKLVPIRKNFDIIHFMLTSTKLNVLSFKTFIKSKGVKTIQTVATLREDLYSDAEIKKLMFADQIVTYSKYAKNKLNGLRLNNISQIYPGIDLNLYSPAPKDDQLMKELDLTENDFVVTYPGEFTRLGATDDIVNMIVENAQTMREKNIKIVFALRVKNSEDRWKKDEVKKTLAAKGLSELVRLPETFTTLDKMLNASDVIIFPIRDMKGKFDVPLVVVEAMACAKPVVISDLPILAEFSNSGNSVIIKSGYAKQLVDVILDLQQNKEKREVVGKNARNYVENNFNIKKIAEEYKNIYNNL